MTAYERKKSVSRTSEHDILECTTDNLYLSVLWGIPRLLPIYWTAGGLFEVGEVGYLERQIEMSQRKWLLLITLGETRMSVLRE